MWKLWPHLPDTVARVSYRVDKATGEHVSKPTQAAVVPRIAAGWARSIKVVLADATYIVLWEIPPPSSHRRPLLDLDLHGCIAKLPRRYTGSKDPPTRRESARSVAQRC